MMSRACRLKLDWGWCWARRWYETKRYDEEGKKGGFRQLGCLREALYSSAGRQATSLESDTVEDSYAPPSASWSYPGLVPLPLSSRSDVPASEALSAASARYPDYT
jgi:hypothetical protein